LSTGLIKTHIDHFFTNSESIVLKGSNQFDSNFAQWLKIMRNSDKFLGEHTVKCDELPKEFFSPLISRWQTYRRANPKCSGLYGELWKVNRSLWRIYIKDWGLSSLDEFSRGKHIIHKIDDLSCILILPIMLCNVITWCMTWKYKDLKESCKYFVERLDKLSFSHRNNLIKIQISHIAYNWNNMAKG
jgi:hypothetical protein